jgi:hypothetical protein
MLCWALNLVGHRLDNQQLARQRFKRAGDLVAWLGAIQSQDYSAAKWAVGQRLPASTDAEIEQALAEGSILRTHVLRPTWHFVSPADIRWMLALTAPRVNALSAYYYRQLDLDAAFFTRSQRAMARVLEGGHQLTRQEIASVLQHAGLYNRDAPGLGRRMGHIMLRAELDGVVCSGARRGKQFTYAMLDERAPRAKTLSRNEALGELSTRYFTSHGPATLQDFVWWSGLTVKDARAALEMVKSKLLVNVSGGQTYWMPAALAPARNDGRKAYLLPNFDEYIVAYADRRAICDSMYAKIVDGRGNVLFNHSIILDGKIAGTWKRTLTKARVTVEVKPFTPIKAPQARAIAAAAERYGAFLGLQTQVSGSLF